MRILVCGGRDFGKTGWYAIEYMASKRQEYNFLWSVLDTHNIHCLIAGGAPGADTAAKEWAFARDIPIQVYVPDWSKDGKAAGPIRNQVMLDHGRPDLVLAFPGGKGTADMVKRAERANVKVQRYSNVDFNRWLKNEQ